MDDLLLLRPPPRELLEEGPPQSMVGALQQFEAKRLATEAEADDLARRMQIEVPPP